MTKQIIALLALLSVGLFGAVYAETTTVEVPFDSHGQTCSFDQIAVEFHCIWQGWKEVYTIEDLKEYKELLTVERYDQEIQKLNEMALEEIKIEQAKLTPNEKTIQSIEKKLDRGIATARDSVLMNMLKELNTCKQGMDERTSHIQTAREFEISDFQLWSVNNVKYDGALGEIAMAIEECEAQEEVYKLSIGYENFEHTKQYSLADKFTSDIQAIPFSQWTETNSGINKSLICDSNQHSQQYKKQFGCIMLYDGLDAESIKAQNELRFGTDGKIHYQKKMLSSLLPYNISNNISNNE